MRIVALDQRGHGWSGHVHQEDYSRNKYLQDIHILIEEELGGVPVVILGHSLGGVDAYQFAAKYPEFVKALSIEDIGAEIKDDQTWVAGLPSRVPTMGELRQSLENLLGEGSFSYFQESAIEHPDGWAFRFDADGMIRSQEMLNGSWWSDWKASSCPLLLMQGEKSPILGWDHAQEMTRRRSNTKLLQFSGCGHCYFNAIQNFLSKDI